MLTKSLYSSIIKEEWSQDFYDELRPELGVASLVQNEYEGVISAWGDTVNVQKLATGGRAQVLTNDNEAYDDQDPVWSNIQLVVDKSAVYSTSVTNWAKYQANPRAWEQYRKVAVHECARAIDETILAAFSASASTSSVTAMTKALFAKAQRVLSQANVPMQGRIALIDPQYYEDLVQVNEIISRDFNPTSSVLLDGVIKDPIYGFKTYVSNLLSADTAWFFHPSFFQVAVQEGGDYKELDLEASTRVDAKRIRVKNLFGVKLFDNTRCYKIYNT